MRLSPSWRLVPFALFLLASLLLLNSRKVARPVVGPRSTVDIEALIDQLPAVSHGDIGYSGMVSGSSFTPLEPDGHMYVVLLSNERLVPSEVLGRIVKQGAAAVPSLLAHLDDKRPTHLEIGVSDPKPLNLFFCNTPDFNARTTRPPPGEDDRDLLTLLRRDDGQDEPSTHTVTVGDLCFVALGQIVNRDFSAVRYQPTGFVIVSSPTHSPALCAAVRKEWVSLTPARHRAALSADFRRPDFEGRRIEACRRFAYYYPDELAGLVLPFLTAAHWEISTKEMANLIAGGLIYDADARIDRLLRDLLTAIEDDDGLALACMARLVGRGYDVEIERYCRRRIPANGERTESLRNMVDKLGWTRAHVAVAARDQDDLRALLRRRVDVDVAARSGETPLHLAAANGSTDLVRLLLSAHPRLDEKNRQGLTAAQLAARADHEAIVRMLVEQGCAAPDILVAAAGAMEEARAILEREPHAVEAATEHGRTPLHLAARRRDAAMAALLLRKGAAPAAADEDGVMPLHEAVYQGDASTTRLLLEHHAPVDAALKDSGFTPLHIAVREKHVEIVRLLLAHKPSLKLEAGDDRQTALHLAVSLGQRAVAEMLLAAGAPINASDREGRTALYRAAEKGEEAMARMLLEHGADVARKGTDSGATPLHLAAAAGGPEMARLLLVHGAKVDATDRKGRTPLHAAAAARVDLVRLSQERYVDLLRPRDQHGAESLRRAEPSGWLEVARLLLAHHADLSARDKDGDTPLHLASYQGRADLVRFLLDRGADVRAKDWDDEEPLHRAVEGGRTVVAEILLDHRADVNICPAYPRYCTPLHEAVSRRNADMVRLLLSRGADREAIDENWRTPLLCAVHNNAVDIARVLLERGADVRAVARDEGLQPLHIAAGHENGAAMIALLLDYKAGINAQDRYDGRTALHIAVADENEAAIRVLLQRGADWTIQDNSERSALDLARESDEEAILDLFRGHGALR